MHGVAITELIEKMNLRNMTPEIDAEKIVLSHPDVNRPALQLAGFFDHFDNERVQIIGYVEQEYIRQMEHDRKVEMYDKLLSSQIPCLVYSRNQDPDEDMIALCDHYGVPCLVSEQTTSDLMAEIIRWLKVKLAPCISIHGVLVDVFGEGVASRVGDAADGAGHLAPEGLFDFDVIRFRQLVQLYRKVARRGSGLLPDKDEIGAFDPDEDRHHGQTQFGMQQGVEFFKHGSGVRCSAARFPFRRRG